MHLTPVQTLITILVVSLGTQITRWIPFLLFPENKSAPRVVLYLGKVLPPAMMGLLVVYCFKSATPLVWPHALPELIAGAYVVLVHHWKHNLVLSIGGGTVLYMLLVQLVFA